MKNRMNGSYPGNNWTMINGIIEMVFKETECDSVYWIQLHWIWLTGRNCVSNDVTYCTKFLEILSRKFKIY